MRWDGQQPKSDDEAGRLPGVAADPVVRTFDAPEAMGIRFHEIEARSALNEVPPMSYVDFRWTINPYRGCTHACAYCMAPDTPVLLADGTSRPIADLKPGDAIYGTRREGRYRRYVETDVRALWRTRKRAFRIELEDGTVLVASGDHRFLTDRGWKYVTGSEQGRGRRPHLTTSNRLLGYGRSAATPDHDHEYKLGYLCGMLRGDAHIGSYRYTRSNGRPGDVHRFRLALADEDALTRSQQYLADLGVRTDTFLFAPGNSRHRRIGAIRTSARDGVERCRELIRWPTGRPSSGWSAGFLGGMFDAEGSNSRGIIRITNTDREIIDQTAAALDRMGLRYAVEQVPRSDRAQIYSVRLLGGLRSRMKLLTACDPAIPRKRSIAGECVKQRAPLGVVSIEPLPGRKRLIDITTGTGDFIASGVISHNCFARPTHTYLDLNAREDFEREIVVKVNLPEVLRAELRRPSWRGEHVALGTNTDPYQWVEGRYGITRGVFERLLEARNPCSVLTKSPLLLRDLDLFEQLSNETEFAANLSIPTLDEKAWRSSEPATPHPRKRIEAVAELSAAGIRTGVLVAPLMPGINDSPAQVNEILELCGEAGAASVSGIGLHLRGEVREIFLDWLRQYRPDLLDRYERLYAGRAYLPAVERRRLGRLVRRGRYAAVGRAQRAPRIAGSARSGSRPAAGPAGVPQQLF